MPAVTYQYGQNRELFEVMQEMIPDFDPNDELLSLFPYKYKGKSRVEWEQLDNQYGLMQLRGVGGKPQYVDQQGVNSFSMIPGYYGEYTTLNEDMLTQGRQIGTYGDVVDIKTLVLRNLRLLMGRRYDTMRKTLVDLCTTGTFRNVTADGRVLHTDTFNLTIRVPGTPWISNPATATPLADLRNYKQLQELNTSSRFGSDSKLIANQASINAIVNNRNPNDLFGVRLELGSTAWNLNKVNELLIAEDLPRLVPYQRTYQTAPGNASVFTKVIPDGKFIWVGTRPDNMPVGNFIGTLNANESYVADGRDATGEGIPSELEGMYVKVIDNTQRQVPIEIEVHHGFNGGPAIYYPTAVQAISTS